MIDLRWLLYLAIPAGWTLFFSMFTSPGIRGWRNFGWPACYILGVAMLWQIGLLRGLSTWLAAGLSSGVLYFLYEVRAAGRESGPQVKARPATILDGAFAWPIMLPEVIEYVLADAGVLKSRKATTPNRHRRDSEGGAEQADDPVEAQGD